MKKYLTIEAWEGWLKDEWGTFKNNEWKHLSRTVYYIIVPLLMMIFAAVVANFIIG